MSEQEPKPLQWFPLESLIECIVEHGDQDALNELHDHRTVFTFGVKTRLRLVEYLDCLRNLEAKRGEDRIADHAYDLTVAKFSRLPSTDEAPRAGTDCRRYFRPFVERMKKDPVRKMGGVVLLDEYRAAQRLQGLVGWHFKLSLRESGRRECPGMSRYDWKLSTGTISVLMPKSLAGRRRGEWLNANIQDPDAGRPDENHRVQDIVNQHFGHQFEPLDENAAYGQVASDTDKDASADDLIEALAEEKAERQAELSRRIRGLTRASLKKMIRAICNELMEEESGEEEIAKSYCIGKVEFSRFAGTRWAARKSVPVLWANLAHLIASREDFGEVARAAGIWPKVERIAGMSTARRVSP